MKVLESDILNLSTESPVTFLTLDEKFPNTKWEAIEWEDGDAPCCVVYDMPGNVVAIKGSYNLAGKEVSFR